MSDDLARLIASNDFEDAFVRKEIFESEFQTADQWASFIKDHFGTPPSVTNILRKGGPDLAAIDFQALYIACWIHFPVEKGSYMIELSDVQRRNIKQGYEKLGLRKSSHFSGHGRSAAWEKCHFLKGYHELLVQLEGGGKHSPGLVKYLYLKAEGHTMVSYDHMKGWVQKEGIALKFGGKKFTIVEGTGKGETASEALKDLGARGAHGITDRAAENFNPAYKALLSSLGLKSKSTTVQEAAGEIYLTLKFLISLHIGMLDESRKRMLGQGGFNLAIGKREIAALPNAQLANFIRIVLVPLSQAMANANALFNKPEVTAFVTKMKAAEQDLQRLATRLVTDAAHTGKTHVDRVSEEIRVSQDKLDESLQSFLSQIS